MNPFYYFANVPEHNKIRSNVYIIIENALATDNFYYLYNYSGYFIKNIASVENSAIEFITPILTLLANNDVVISDMNRGNAIIYKNDMDTILQYEGISWELLKKVPLININDDTFVTINNFLNGDNVLNSNDSRYWGFVLKEFVIGVVSHITYSRDRVTDEFRWNRLMKSVLKD